MVENNSDSQSRAIDTQLDWYAQQRLNAKKRVHICIKTTGLALMATTLENWGVAPEIQ